VERREEEGGAVTVPLGPGVKKAAVGRYISKSVTYIGGSDMPFPTSCEIFRKICIRICDIFDKILNQYIFPL
jgi:hypothetical protein